MAITRGGGELLLLGLRRAAAMAVTTAGRGELLALWFNHDRPRHRNFFFFLFLSSDPPHQSLLLLCPHRIIIRPTNEYALLSSSSTSLTSTALLPSPSAGRMDMTRKEALWINNRLYPPWLHARLPVMLQFQGQQPSAFSTLQGSGHAGRLVRMEQLWQEFFSDPSQWWDNRFTKKSPKYPDFKHKSTREGLWVDGWLNPSWVKEKMASMALGHILT